MKAMFCSGFQLSFWQALQQNLPKNAFMLGAAGWLATASPLAGAVIMYQVSTPDGRTVTVNNPTKAYQLNPDTTKIIVIDTDKIVTNNPPPANDTTATPYIAPTYTTSIVNNGDTTTKTVTVTQPINTPVVSENNKLPASDFEELNISSTKASKAGDYQLALLTPTPDTLYRKPAQTIDISLAINPALKKGDSINIAIDGHVIKNGKDLTYQIPSLDINPDKHTLSVTLINVLNKPIASAETSFYLVQNTPLIQKQRQLKKQLAAYDALPWYEKLKLRLGFEDKDNNHVSFNPSAKK